MISFSRFIFQQKKAVSKLQLFLSFRTNWILDLGIISWISGKSDWKYLRFNFEIGKINSRGNISTLNAIYNFIIPFVNCWFINSNKYPYCILINAVKNTYIDMQCRICGALVFKTKISICFELQTVYPYEPRRGVVEQL